jgi:hypothetical protein
MKFDPNTVTWHDTSDITMIACTIDDKIEDIQEKYHVYFKAEENNNILDQEEVNDALKQAEEDEVSIEVYEEQLNRWKKGSLTTIQEKKVDRIFQELEKYKELHEKYISMLTKLSDEIAKKPVNLGPEMADSD